MEEPGVKKMVNAFQKTLKGVEDQNKNIMNRVAHLWMRDERHDFNITLQRLIYLLRLSPASRTADQLAFLRHHFEESYKYIQQIKDKLNESIYVELFSELQYEHHQEHEVIFNQGDTGRKMYDAISSVLIRYFILQGEVGILIPNGIVPEENPIPQKKPQIRSFDDLVKFYYPHMRLVAVKKDKEYFGEIAIEQRIPRTATVITKTEVHSAVLSYESYQRILGQYKDLLMQEKLEFLLSIPIFSGFNKQGLCVLLHGCEEVSFSTKTLIYKRNEKAKHCYLIQSGEVMVETWQRLPNKALQRNQTLGEEEIHKIQQLIMSNHEQKKVLGVYSFGQIFGEYEMHINNYPKEAKRVSQAIACVGISQKLYSQGTKVYQIAYTLFSSMGSLQEFCSIKFRNKEPTVQIPEKPLCVTPTFSRKQGFKEGFTPNEGSIQKLLYRKIDHTGTMKMRALTRKYDNYISHKGKGRISRLLQQLEQQIYKPIKSKDNSPFASHSIRKTGSQESLMEVFSQKKPTSFKISNHFRRLVLVNIRSPLLRIKTQSSTMQNTPQHFQENLLETQRSLVASLNILIISLRQRTPLTTLNDFRLCRLGPRRHRIAHMATSSIVNSLSKQSRQTHFEIYILYYSVLQPMSQTNLDEPNTEVEVVEDPHLQQVKQLEQQIETLKSEHAAQVDQLWQENVQLLGKFELQEENLQQLQNDVELKNSEKKQSEVVLAELNESLGQMERQYKEALEKNEHYMLLLSQQSEGNTVQLATRDKTITDLQEQLDSEQSELRKVKDDLHSVRAELTREIDHGKKIELQLSQSQSYHQDLEQQFENVQNQLRTQLESSLKAAKLESQLEESQFRVSQLEKDIETEREKAKNHLDQQLSQNKQQIAALQDELSNIKAQAGQAQEGKKMVQIAVEELVKWDKRSKDLMSQVKMLQIENQTLKLDLEQKERLQSSKQMKNDLSLEGLQERCKALQHIIDSTSFSNAKLETSVQNLTELNGQLKEDLSQSEIEIRQLREISREKFRIETELAEANATIEELRGQAKDVQQTRAKLTAAENELGTLQKLSKANEQQKQKFQKLYEDSYVQLQEAQAQRDKFQHDKETLTSKLRDFERLLASQFSEVAELEQRNKDSLQSIEDLKNQLKITSRKNAAEIEEVRNEWNKQQEHHRQLLDVNRKLQNDLQAVERYRRPEENRSQGEGYLGITVLSCQRVRARQSSTSESQKIQWLEQQLDLKRHYIQGLITELTRSHPTLMEEIAILDQEDEKLLKQYKANDIPTLHVLIEKLMIENVQLREQIKLLGQELNKMMRR